jgi:hypothetical protein
MDGVGTGQQKSEAPRKKNEAKGEKETTLEDVTEVADVTEAFFSTASSPLSPPRFQKWCP